MKQQLMKLYRERQSEFLSVTSRFPDDDIAGPFLMSPNNKYSVQPFRLLIVGQETNGWEHFVDDLEKQMLVYEYFNVGKQYYASPFWNVTRKVERVLNNEQHSCAWTNISKFDVNAGRAHGEYENAISKLDNILIEEIRIVKPNICLFFTGPSFDYRIKKTFDGVEFTQANNMPIKEFSRLKHKDLPDLTFRAYHPNYLRRSGREGDFINFIASLTKVD